VGNALLNLAGLQSVAGFGDTAAELAHESLQHPDLTPAEVLIAEASIAIRGVSVDGDLEAAADLLRRLARAQKAAGHQRHAAITLLNLSVLLDWLGQPQTALLAANEAEIELSRTWGRGADSTAIMAAQAAALTQLGRVAEADRALSSARALPSPLSRDEGALEAARIKATFGSRAVAESALDTIDIDGLFEGYWGTHALVLGDLALRRADAIAASAALATVDAHACTDVAGLFRSLLLAARTGLLRGESIHELTGELRRISDAQRSRPARILSDLVSVLATDEVIHDEVVRIPSELGYCLSSLAEELTRCSSRLSKDALQRVLDEATSRPDRWAEPLLRSVQVGGSSAPVSASLLAAIGSHEDAGALRALAAKHKFLRQAALAITERLAAPVLIEDLGPVVVQLGGVRLRIVRRKVLGLLCFLGSRAGMAATRDETLEALWPELGPDTAGNSLHQTIYFLRRVFEPDFREGLSASYVRYDGEVVSLNDRLLDTDSRRCWKIIGELGGGTGEVESLLRLYQGRFAIDFAYEDWAADYRDNLHAAVLAASARLASTWRRR